MLSKGRDLMGLLVIFLGLVGCAGNQGLMDSEQAHLGRGIVEGTKGYQQIQHEQNVGMAWTQSFQGQVLQIEGGAYMIRDAGGTEIRLPLDENTRIDRPAHIGDWVEAKLDRGGRAVSIRNIDERISLE